MGLGNCISAVVAFVRAGYPAAAPAAGYAPLLALLPRRVSDDEAAAIADRLSAPAGRVDVGVAITRVTDAMPLPDDIERVRRRVAAAGRG